MKLKKTREKSNLTKELGVLKKANSNLKNEIEKLTKDLNAMTSSKFEADGKIKQLEGILQQTQTRLEGTVFAKWLLSTC